MKEVRRKLLSKKRKKELEKKVLDELIQEGLIFPDAEKRPHIPREVIDAVWRRDKGRCVYCGSWSNNFLLGYIVGLKTFSIFAEQKCGYTQ